MQHKKAEICMQIGTKNAQNMQVKCKNMQKYYINNLYYLTYICV